MFNYKKFKIKQSVKFGENQILLLEMYENKLLPKESVANIVAIDPDGNLLWIVEKPHTAHDIYGDIYLKNGKLFSLSAGSQLHEIDLDSGKIITSRMVK